MAAVLLGLGRVLVPAPGTPVVIPPSAYAAITPPSVHALIVQVLDTNVGKIYVGTAGLDKSIRANCLIVLPIPTSNSLPSFQVAVTMAANAISLPMLRIDADTANDGVIVSVMVA
jgi:hypothetical protein